jgi:DNA-binding transcriptional MerR regulator
MATTPSIGAGLRIGELARRCGRSVHTIRWYESQRLIPGVRRDGGGMRVYHELHVQWLELLERLRRSGMSIRQMREYATLVRRGDATLAQRRDLLAAHRERVRGQIGELAAAVSLVDAKVAFYDQWIATGHRPREDAIIDAAARSKRAA